MERPTNSSALTQGMRASLDRSQSTAATPNFWSSGSVFPPTMGKGAGGENVRQFIGAPGFGRRGQAPSKQALNAHRTINHPLNCSFFLVHVLSFSMHIFTCPNNMICLPSLHLVQDKS
jgi:hypothetical protein